MGRVTQVLARLKTGTYTLTRRAAGSYVDGRFVDGASSTITGVVASVQPFPDRERRNLPEGIQTADARVFFTETPVQVADDTAKVPGDRVAIGGENFEAIKVEPWGGDLLPHYRVTFVRRSYGS